MGGWGGGEGTRGSAGLKLATHSRFESTSLPAMAKAMKAMKAIKAMKAMKKKIVSKVGKGRMAKAMVLRGSKAKTVGGLTAKDLVKNKRGKIVSKKMASRGKASPWIKAVAKARAALKIKGFCAIKKGTPLYLKAKEFYGN